MTREQLVIALRSDDVETLVDVDDWAVNTLRDHCKEYHIADIGRLVSEERGRIHKEGITTLGDYLRCSRVGSRFRLSRRARMAVYGVVAAKTALAGRV